MSANLKKKRIQEPFQRSDCEPAIRDVEPCIFQGLFEIGGGVLYVSVHPARGHHDPDFRDRP